jgi:hypothetical protein
MRKSRSFFKILSRILKIKLFDYQEKLDYLPTLDYPSTLS